VKKGILCSIVALALVLGLALSMVTPVMASEIQLAKNTDPLTPNKYYVGDTIHYVLMVANPSSNNATNYVDVVEDILPDGTTVTLATNVTQAPGESDTYYLNYLVDEADLQFIGGHWRVMNTLHVAGTDSLFDIIDATTSKSSFILRPELSIEKTVDFNNDSVFTDSETYYAGEPADWAINVTNTGYDPVYNITVSDDNMGVDFHGPFDLNPGESEIVPIYTTYPTADTLNTACAQGVDEIGGIVGPVCNPAEVFVIEPDTEVTITSSADMVVPGTMVFLTVTEHNAGDVDLTSPQVAVTKDGTPFVTLVWPPTSGDNDNKILDPGETWSWTINLVLITATTTFVATGSGIAPGDFLVTYPGDQNERDDVTIDTFEPNTITTITASETLVMSGDSVALNVTEENTGGDPLTNPRVEVWKNGTLIATLVAPPDSGDNGNNILDPLETWSWTIYSGPITTTTTFVALGFGTDSLGHEVSYDQGYEGERDDVTVNTMGPDTITTITASATWVGSGGSVNLTVTEQNTGDDPLTNPYVLVNPGGYNLNKASPYYAGGDTNGNDKLDTTETWRWTNIPSGNITATTTFVALGFGTDSLGQEVSYAQGYLGERDYVTVNTMPPSVGWETYPINKLAVLAPWIALLAAIMVGAGLLVLRRRRI